MKKFNFLTLLIIATGAASCNHKYYAPNTANAPLLSEKGETRINALYSGGSESEFEGGELQFATAVSKNFAIMVNGMAVGKTENVSDWNSSHNESGHGVYAEFAGGIFKSFDEKKKWIGEIYGGVGFGSANNDYGPSGSSKVNTTKFFIQPSIGYKSKYFEFALVPKVSLVNWSVKKDNATSDEYKYDLNTIRQNPSFLAFEPAVILRAGGENFKIQFSTSFSNFNKTSYVSGLKESLISSIGISINLHPHKK